MNPTLIKKQYLVTDKSGRSAKPYLLDDIHIIKYWELSDTDDDDEVTLAEFIEDSELGDRWVSGTVKLECIN